MRADNKVCSKTSAAWLAGFASTSSAIRLKVGCKEPRQKAQFLTVGNQSAHEVPAAWLRADGYWIVSAFRACIKTPTAQADWYRPRERVDRHPPHS